MTHRILVEDVTQHPIEQVLASVAYADPAKHGKRLVMFADVGEPRIWFHVLVDGQFHAQYDTVDEAVREYSNVPEWKKTTPDA